MKGTKCISGARGLPTALMISSNVIPHRIFLTSYCSAGAENKKNDNNKSMVAADMGEKTILNPA